MRVKLASGSTFMAQYGHWDPVATTNTLCGEPTSRASATHTDAVDTRYGMAWESSSAQVWVSNANVHTWALHASTRMRSRENDYEDLAADVS